MAAVGCRRSRVRGLVVGMGTGECTRLASAGPRESRRRAWLARVGGMGNTPSIHGNGERHAAVPSTGRQGAVNHRPTAEPQSNGSPIVACHLSPSTS
jgi:hypothetical protein